MRIVSEGFTHPKAGASVDQNDDALLPGGRVEWEGDCFRCAVADGATESIYAGRWAKLLAEVFVRGEFDPLKVHQTIREVQTTWGSYIADQPLPWYAEAKAKEGSFSTLLGLELLESVPQTAQSAKWKATALGDSCLFLVRNDHLQLAWPIADPTEFNNRPRLLASNPERNSHFDEWREEVSGDLRMGDSFFLLTDALALRFLEYHARGQRPWCFLARLGLPGNPNFAQWVDTLRHRDDRMNDDATMIRIQVSSL